VRGGRFIHSRTRETCHGPVSLVVAVRNGLGDGWQRIQDGWTRRQRPAELGHRERLDPAFVGEADGVTLSAPIAA